MKKIIVLILMVLILVMVLTACSSNIGKIENGYTNYGNLSSSQFKRPEIGEEIAVITTNKGVIKARLLEENAPIYVENFKKWVREGAYDGERFARGRENAFISMHSDDFHNKYKLDEDYELECKADYRKVTGSLASIISRGEYSSTFFITANDKVDELLIDRMENLSDEYGYTKEVIKAYKKLGGDPEQDYRYTIFGQVFYGLDTVFEISRIPTELVEGRYTMFTEDVIIEKIELLPYEGDV